ncbi:hypothetical protein [Algibacter sp. PT7-4]|uniref:hypothetical protein n=1 Tax=Algibacter ulvanivorans TaxID=3400999 RepID=UPI003AAAB29B
MQIIIYVLIGGGVLFRGAVYFPDSYTFLDMAFNHSPVYCVFLKIVRGVFGASFEIPLLIIQYIFIIIGVNYLLDTLKDIFRVSEISLIIIQIICLAPCVYLHDLGNAILSEAITYPLFLIIFSLSLKMIIKEKLTYLYKICPLLIILILTRGQFLTVIPVLLLVVLYIVLKVKVYAKNFNFFILILIIPIISSLSERVYNKVVFGHFVNNSMNFVHLIASPFYVSTERDVTLFSNKEEIEYFNLIHNSLKEAELTHSQSEAAGIDKYVFYHDHFPEICNRRIYELGLQYFKDKGLNFVEQNIALNALCKKMFFPLIKTNFKTWFTLFFKNLKNSFNTAKQMLFFLMLMVLSIVYLRKHNNSILKFTALTILFMFANNTLIALVIHSIKRYTFYFDWFIFALFLVLINEILNKKNIHES